MRHVTNSKYFIRIVEDVVVYPVKQRCKSGMGNLINITCHIICGISLKGIKNN